MSNNHPGPLPRHPPTPTQEKPHSNMGLIHGGVASKTTPSRRSDKECRRCPLRWIRSLGFHPEHPQPHSRVDGSFTAAPPRRYSNTRGCCRCLLQHRMKQSFHSKLLAPADGWPDQDPAGPAAMTTRPPSHDEKPHIMHFNSVDHHQSSSAPLQPQPACTSRHSTDHHRRPSTRSRNRGTGSAPRPPPRAAAAAPSPEQPHAASWQILAPPSTSTQATMANSRRR
jgi:hypothetical protein